MRYLFAEYVFDTDRRELHRGADVVSVAPQVFDLIDYLIRNRERVVSKDDLIKTIWNGRSVSDAALTTRLNAARVAIGDSGDEQRFIKTLQRKGFRFVGAVREAKEPAEAIVADDQVEVQKVDLALPDRPSIAVLPFENMSGEPEQEYFAEGMVEEIITALSRFKSLFVIARHSTFTFKGKAVDIKEIGRRLGVRYVLEGSVRKASGKVRIAGQLIDAVTGAHLWAERFERDLADVFALQDEVAVAVVSAIQPKMIQTEIEVATRRRPENLTAYDLFLRSMQQYYLTTRESLAEAIRLAHCALDLDPRFGSAAALAGDCHASNVALGYTNDPQFDRKEAVRLARLALRIGDDDPDILSRVAVILAGMVGDSEAEIEMADRAVALNPNSWRTWNNRGWVYTMAGLPEEAILSFERAIRMSPVDPLLHMTFLGIAHALIALRRFDEAIVALKRALRHNPSFLPACRGLASAFAHLGRDVEARAAAARVLEIDPSFTISAHIARSPKSPKLFIEGLRKAGLPE
ncbi:winged helix-turn-helix domain-containing tetratricopeptide repeat protein [Bradyrhizobium sp. WYCCWR 13023]|uniref:Winged helix-turn-helix domain-containing tetratricopeptide repeat protein n=1 Tax=Bradyrhizobium zhengyangense TaxID=2911009 RepID=A0A9X1U5Y6_9BRAD|nr:winged helix-turn-helix domain-containing tetratricopeptide repeat protein [Bradyrhizobium sp. CCBAU 11434]MCG2625276.1 winged helix-turn-helix domain-containing tetratricopeptide repeat protein [Bradyrhizobium zhengyangense]MDA9524840.1 adenylate cyclase 3 [Bradyrhizobium sp. CCBAU 11434]